MPGELVIYRDGWGFQLARTDCADESESGKLIALTHGDKQGIYLIGRVEETDDERRVHVGEMTGFLGESDQPSPGYPFPANQDEIGRLRREYESRGGNPATFNAWAQGDDYNAFTSWARAELRTMRAR